MTTNVDYLPSENTLTRTLHLLREYHHVPNVNVHLEKRIPAQSGLGGGSSDAAGLMRLIKKHLSPEVTNKLLAETALRVGADVPFFLVGGRADAEGYGEKLTPLPDNEESHYVVVKPAVDCSTPAMFKALNALSYTWEELPEDDRLYNDFERVMPPACQDMIDHLLANGAIDAGLSGSGSAVFGRFESSTEALTVAELIKGSGADNVWACRSLSREESLS